MRAVRMLLSLATIATVCLVGLLVAGGLSYRIEEEFVPIGRVEAPLPLVHVQNSRGAGWGKAEILGGSEYGAPFQVFVGGTLPVDHAARAVAIRDLRVEADGVAVSTLQFADLGLAPALSMKIDSIIKVLSFGSTPVVSLSASPKTYRISGSLLLTSNSGVEEIRFSKSFDNRRTRRVSIGAWSWFF